MFSSPIIECPHCKIAILVEAMNCRIFRCGMYKSNGTQIDPHLDQVSCERLYNDRLVYGCGKPFRVDMSGNPVLCGYI
jgi:hypothetical protein